MAIRPSSLLKNLARFPADSAGGFAMRRRFFDKAECSLISGRNSVFRQIIPYARCRTSSPRPCARARAGERAPGRDHGPARPGQRPGTRPRFGRWSPKASWTRPRGSEHERDEHMAEWGSAGAGPSVMGGYNVPRRPTGRIRDEESKTQAFYRIIARQERLSQTDQAAPWLPPCDPERHNYCAAESGNDRGVV
jgi:hypothetical protein